MKRIFTFFLLTALALSGTLCAQTFHRPRLVVGIVVDQMRWDALHLYSHRYTKGGFRRLMEQGTEWTDCRLAYLPAITAVGHASTYTGTTPAFHGIVANSFEADGWYGASVEDKEYGASPRRMLTTTVSDELRMAQGMRGRTFSVAMKDRASILPGGHTANMAVWWSGSKNSFVTSKYYAPELPKWIQQFNAERNDTLLMKQQWPKNLLYPADTYLHRRDTEAEFSVGEDIFYTPMGGTLTLQLAERALVEERLGQGEATDMLCISISSTDGISHRTGPDSPLMEDTYLRLDRDLEHLFRMLDKQVGKDGWMCFLTADHAGQHSPAYRQQQRIPSLTWQNHKIQAMVDSTLHAQLGTPRGIIRGINAFRLEFNKQRVAESGIDPQQLTAATIAALEQSPLVQYAFDVRQAPTHVPQFMLELVRQGYYKGRIGEVAIVPRAGVSEAAGGGANRMRGTNHALWTPDDTHIPLLMMGPGIPQGQRIATRAGNIDIVPTLCHLLRIPFPSGCTGTSLLDK